MLLVNLDRPSPRARYVVRHVFERMLGWPVQFAASAEAFRTSDGPRLSYGPLPIEGAFHVPSDGALDMLGVGMREPAHHGSGDDLVLFPVDEGSDVFAACFYLLALFEEYAVDDRDAHDRPRTTSLFVVRHGVERFPLLDRWVLRLAEDLRRHFPELPVPKRAYRHVLTVDVDNGLKYAGRSFKRAFGASLKELLQGDVLGLRERWQVRRGAMADPYLRAADELAAVLDGVDRFVAFILARGEEVFDHGADIDHPAYRELIQRLAALGELGLHPSYGTSRNAGLLDTERQQLQHATTSSIHLSRQHFLRWRMPDTLRHLHDTGFTEDHTLGFSDRIGFRAGTCTPFPWYDLEREQETPLILWPFATMDSALSEHVGRTPEQALSDMKEVADAVRAVNGTFVSVWHDRYLSGDREFASWPGVMRQLVQHARV
ncbi:MAG: polysaccharide deacetylase family protein [Flavobacteriales bacterium]|nr:polysaccharide deacetylase family protein [Flavobacteriales bacterium]